MTRRLGCAAGDAVGTGSVVDEDGVGGRVHAAGRVRASGNRGAGRLRRQRGTSSASATGARVGAAVRLADVDAIGVAVRSVVGPTREAAGQEQGEGRRDEQEGAGGRERRDAPATTLRVQGAAGWGESLGQACSDPGSAVSRMGRQG